VVVVELEVLENNFFSRLYTASPLDRFTVSATTYPITVGGGGAGGISSPSIIIGTSNGSNSIFSTITSAGGGGGGENPLFRI
jgi:hypothetical protein